MPFQENVTEGEISKAAAERVKQDKQQDPGPTVFSQYPIGSWTVGGSPQYAFPVRTVSESGGNRIVRRERPFRNGAKCDDTHSKPKVWTIQAIFDNSLTVENDNPSLGEPGLKEINGETPLYPDILNELIGSFDLYHDTPGDLVIPTRGKVRARLEDYTRDEVPEDLDCASLRLTFVEDNEDSVDAAAYTGPSVNANAIQLADSTEFSAESCSGWDDDMMNLNEVVANLEGIANMPANYAADIDQQVGIAIGAANRLNETFSQPKVPGRDIFLDPESSVTRRKLEQSKEIAHQAKHNYKKQFNVITLVFEDPQSLTSVAAMLGQDLNVLISLNTQLADPFYIVPGEQVKVVSDEPST